MKNKAFLLFAVSTLLVSAVPAFAVAPDPTGWLGDWVFTYSNDVTDTVTFTAVCVASECPGGGYFEYFAKGRKSDNSSILIIKIAAPFYNTKSLYFEETEAEFAVCKLDCPSATITDSNFLACGAFQVSEKTDPVTLVSGKKADADDSCGFTATTTTTSVPKPAICPAAKLLGADNPKLEQIRDLRDSALAKTFLGGKIIQIYYSNAAGIDAALDRSPALRAAALRVLEAIAVVEDK